MKSIQTKFLCSFIVIALVVAKPALADTQILLAASINAADKFELNYTDAVRLDRIVEDGLANLPAHAPRNPAAQPVYWTGAALLDMSKTKISVEKNLLQDQIELITQQSSSDTEKVAALQTLHNYLEELSLAQRIFLPLDLDFVRIQTAFNPVIDGRYQLILPLRPSSILILGAVTNFGLTPWRERANVAFYLQQAQPISSADNSYAWIIQPDGVVEQHPFAYWNKSHRDIAPGAIIYLGFGSLPAGFSSINEDLAALLRNRSL